MAITTTALSVGASVRACMDRSGVTQSELADVLGLSQVAISRRLTGKVAFNVAELGMVAGHLGVSVNAFLSEVSETAA